MISCMMNNYECIKAVYSLKLYYFKTLQLMLYKMYSKLGDIKPLVVLETILISLQKEIKKVTEDF